MNKYMILIAAQFILCQAVVATQMTPSEMLERYETNQRGLQSHVIKSEDIVEINDTGVADHSRKWIRSVSEIRRDRGRVDLIMHQWPKMDHKDEPTPPERAYTIRVIWDGETWLEHEYRNKDAPGRVVVSTREHEKEKREYIAVGYYGSPLDGIFTGDLEPVTWILGKTNNMRLRDDMEMVAGVPCYVIEASTTSNGDYTIWIDPKHGYNIVKARVHKTGSDILYGKAMMRPSKLPPGVSVGYKGKQKPPGSRITEFSFALSNVRLEKIGDVWVPMEADYEYTRRFPDGRSITDNRHHKRTHIDIAPDFEAIAAFVPDIPDGTRVWVTEFPLVRYIWQKGEILPDVDGLSFEEIDKTVDELKKEEKK